MQKFGLLCLQRLDTIQAETTFLLLLQEDKRVSANRVVSPRPQNYICFQLRPCVNAIPLTTVWVNQNYYIRLLRPGLHADSSHEKSLSRSKWNRLAKLSGFHTNRTRSSSANVKLWLCVSPGPKTRKGGGAIMAFRGRVPPKRGTFLRLQVCGKVGITGVEVYTMVGKSVLLVCRVILLDSWNR